jgi:hypothetical protein
MLFVSLKNDSDQTKRRNTKMGFFSNPFKATKAFLSNPIGVLDRDINRFIHGRRDNDPPSVVQCKTECASRSLDYNPPSATQNKTHFSKGVGDIALLRICNQRCER